MRVGLIGAGNMARALARGWGEPVLCSDSGSGRATQLADELGGTAPPTNLEVASQADLVVLCHKPNQLEQVAREIRGAAKAVASVLGATSTGQLQACYPGTPVFSLMPNTPVEVRRGVIVYTERPDSEAANASSADPQLESQVIELFERLGIVVRVPEALVAAAAALMSVGPAYEALVAEAQVDAGVRRGLPAQLASRLVVETMAGTAALLERRAHDTLAVRREVTSPGGTTARGLAALEAAGVRSAFQDAIDAVLDGGGPPR
jgi:pyrroline-5-carboxylate reductase